MFCTRVAWVCLVCFLLCKAVGASPSSVFAITERLDMGLYEMPLSMSLLGFGMDTLLANFHMCGIMLVLRAIFNMLVRNASPSRAMCFRCLMFSLSGPFCFPFLLSTSAFYFCLNSLIGQTDRFLFINYQ